MNKKRQTVIIVGIIIGMVISIGVAIPYSVNWYRSRVRRDWKGQALAEIRKQAVDPAWIRDEIASIENTGWWQSQRLLLMKNGEWLLYKHEDRKRDWRIDDIMIAKSSDGRWYYSTFHFCVDLVALSMCQETQPTDLDYFLSEYRFEEFDGSSDECLKETAMWPLSWDKRRMNQ